MNLPHLRSRRLGVLLMAGLVAVVVLAACSGSKPRPAGTPQPFNPLSSTTTSTVDPNALHVPAGFQLPDTRFVSLSPVSGKPQPIPPIPVMGGKASVSGTITGPGGAVAGATVRIERWVGSASGAITVASDGGGHYTASGLLGGHYKVRAWQQPTLTTFTAGTGFVADGGHLNINLPLTQYNAYTVQVAASAGAAQVGQAFSVKALVTQQTVDPNGVVQPVGVPSVSVQLSTDPSVTVAGANPGTTGSDGLATWTLTCQSPGTFTANVTSANGSTSGPLPVCQAVSTTEPAAHGGGPAGRRVLHPAGHRPVSGRHLHRQQRRLLGLLSGLSRRHLATRLQRRSDHGPVRTRPGVHGQPRIAQLHLHEGVMSPSTGAPGAARRPRRRRALRLTLRAAVVTVVGVPLLVAVAGSAAFGMLLYVNLPGTFPKARPPKAAQPSTVYDAAGNVIGTFRKFDLSVPMTEAQVPTDLQNAVIASEDRKFWTHKGVDPEGMVRAAVADYTSGKVEQGASTITQQYIRATYLNDQKTVSRKLNEAVLATRFERDLTKQLGSQHAAKERIMYLYLNTTYFGDGAYGAAAAAESYFHTDVSHLTISEAATLVSIIPSPSRYGPRQDLFGAESRRVQVLGEMRDQGLITQAQYDQAKAAYLWPAGFGDPGGPTTAFYPLSTNGPAQDPYFVDFVQQYLTQRYGDAIYTQGLKIQTTIDPTLQAEADATEAKYMAKAPIDRFLDPTTHQVVANPQDMAIVTVDPATGYIKAMAGGRNYAALQVNLATGGTQGMQPGSSFKAFTIAAALEQGITPAQTYPTPGVYYPAGCPNKDSCAIHNDEGGSEGTVDMQTALTASINTWFAQLARDVGPDNVQAMAKRLGVTIVGNQPCCDERVTLGVLDVTPLSMASAYGVFANHGVRMPATPIVKVTKADGTVLIDNTHPTGKQVLNPAIAETVAQLLKGPPGPGGTAGAHLAGFGRPIAGKTGTTNDETNGWFVGFTPQLATAVWMGHDGAVQHLNYPGVGAVFGGTVPAGAWGDYMKLAVANLPPTDFPIPGPLPPPNSAADAAAVLDPSTRRPNRQTIPQLPTDCDGPCSHTTTLTTPPPPPTTTTTIPVPTTVPATTSTTTPRTTTTNPKGHG